MNATDTKKEGILSFSFVSDATIKCPANGIELIHEITSKHQIPVNWVVNYRTCQIFSDLFERFHKENGDDLIFQIQSTDPVMDNPGMEDYRQDLEEINNIDEYRKIISTQKGIIQKIHPWAQLKIASLSIFNNSFIDALKLEGFTSVWGIDWEKKKHNKYRIEGTPKGIYRLGKAFNIPVSENIFDDVTNYKKNNLIAIEKTTKDLIKSLYSKKEGLYSFETLNIQKKGICSSENIGYWKRLINIYEANLRYNPIIPIIQCQPAHELEFTMQNNSFRFPYQIKDAYEMLDKFFNYIRCNEKVKILTLQDLSEKYFSLELPNGVPNYLLLDDIIIPYKKYQMRIRSREYKKEYHYSRLKYAYHRFLGRNIEEERPEKLPKNGKNFPSIFFFQDSNTQLYFNYKNISKEINRPFKQYIYDINRIITQNMYPVIKDYLIKKIDNQIEYDLTISAPIQMPWGILLKGSFRELVVNHDHAKTCIMCNDKSKIFDDFAFVFLFLRKGISKFSITALS